MDAVMVVVEWQFTPPDYFEESIRVARDEYTLVIADGKAQATILAQHFDATPSLRDTLHRALNARFLAVQLLNHSPFELSKPSIVRVRPDGRRDIFIELEPLALSISLGSVDVQVKDRHGNVVSDSRRDRIDRKRSFSDLVSSHSGDGLLSRLLTSYRNIIRNADNELVYLYEIRDALSTRFDGEKKTRTTLGIAASDWSRLGQLCNDEPLRQGRHRGENEALRDATHSELEEARTIARSMIEKYLQSLGTPIK